MGKSNQKSNHISLGENKGNVAKQRSKTKTKNGKKKRAQNPCHRNVPGYIFTFQGGFHHPRVHWHIPVTSSHSGLCVRLCLHIPCGNYLLQSMHRSIVNFKNNSMTKQDSWTEKLHCMPKKIVHVLDKKRSSIHSQLIVFCFPSQWLEKTKQRCNPQKGTKSHQHHCR